MAASLSSYFIGRGKTRVVMWVTVASASINVVLDIVWIFGYLGFPAAGIEGAAWATVTAQWFRVIAYALIILFSRDRSECCFSNGRKLDPRFMLRMLRFGGPNGLQFVIEGCALTVFGLLMAQIGKNEAAASTLAFSVNMVAFVPMLGVGTAVSTIVGQQIGRGRIDLAVRTTWTATGLALAYTGLFGILYLAVPSAFMMGHAAGTVGFGEIQPLAVILLRFVAAYCLFDAIQLIFVSAIKGAGDTLFVLCTTVVWSVSFVVIGIGGARIARQLDWEMYWWWVLITVWIWLLAAVYFVRFLQGRWKTMRVIDSDESRASSPLHEVVPAVDG